MEANPNADAAELDPNLALLTEGLEAVAARIGTPPRRDAWDAFLERVAREPDPALPLTLLAHRFELDDFELAVVLMTLGAQVEPGAGAGLAPPRLSARFLVDRLCADAVERRRAHQSLRADGKLARHLLATVTHGQGGRMGGLLEREVSLEPTALRYLLGEPELSEDLARLARLERPNVSLLNVILPPEPLVRVRELAEQHGRWRALIADWGFDRVLPYGRGLTLLFSGPSGTGKTLLAHALASHTRRPLLSLSGAELPARERLEPCLRELFAEATLRDAVVLIDECEGLLGVQDPSRVATFKALEGFDGIVVLATNRPDLLDPAFERRIVFHVPFELPDPSLRHQLWEVHLPPEVPLSDDVDLAILADRFDFPGGTIKNAILTAMSRALALDEAQPRLTMALLDAACEAQLRYALEDLTTRTTTHLRLRDIVLPDEPRRKVVEIISAIKNQATVLNRWGFGKKLVTGKGITVLFDGPPGTGKTLCAEIIAGEFDRPLYRVSLPDIVSKWVGETEKHIKQLFQQARVSHAMLLFDEADALFASRTAETKSSTDRYANMEVNLLLQEIERFPGVVILTTNFFGSLDRALIRRIQFRVTFTEPDAAQRALIWQTLCPAEAPLDAEVDWGELAATYEMTGGMIKNSLLRAAYLACERGTDITSRILADACHDEYKAAGRVARDPNFVPARDARLDELDRFVAGAKPTPPELMGAKERVTPGPSAG